MLEPVSDYRLSPAARQDLDAIWDHSARVWSADQADRYIRALATDMALLAQHPRIARERTEIDPPVRLYQSGGHLIIYRITPDWLNVLRIVHHRQNWTTLLAD
jgi:toxin ParE1/3/4